MYNAVLRLKRKRNILKLPSEFKRLKFHSLFDEKSNSSKSMYSYRIVVDIYHYFEFIEPIQGGITLAIIRRCRENKEKIFLFILSFHSFFSNFHSKKLNC